MRILAIETSCDETAMAVVECSGGHAYRLPVGRQGRQGLKNPRFKVLKNVVSSQIETHRPYGGVVPLLAKREHIGNLPVVFQQIQGKSKNEKVEMSEIDMIAVTVGPGLEPALLTGIEFAKDLSKKLKKKLVGANHLEGHLYSFLLTQKTEMPNNKKHPVKRGKNGKSQMTNAFPAVGLIVSGGHTILLLMDRLESWKKIGETRDDAVGEAFDKVARMLGLPYPGGPEIEKIAKNGNSHAIEFPRPMIHHKNFDFSFAGLKTAVYYELMDAERRGLHADQRGNSQRKSASSPRESAFRSDVAASFQEAAAEVLVKKTMRAVETFGAKSVILAGGVAANTKLRNTLRDECKKLKKQFFVSDLKYSGDNAAMIAAATYINLLRKKTYRVQMQANLNL